MKPVYLLGLDIGSSSVKASLVDASTWRSVALSQSPNDEMTISAPRPGWAEQDPELWWHHVVQCIQMLFQNSKFDKKKVAAIGISYQMHGLVCLDKKGKPLIPSIIWCDSRAVAIGEKAFDTLGHEYCLSNLLNSPGNFTASKLKWVKEFLPDVYNKIWKIALPGDYVAMKLTGEILTSYSGLSEGIFWDFKSKEVASSLMQHYGIEESMLPHAVNSFSDQGRISKEMAETLGLPRDTVVAYRAGDQPNNAFSLNVLEPGETAATAGTSGVVYAVTDKNLFDSQSRVNSFIHVNGGKETRNGVLLCVNGTGILNSWLRKNMKGGGKPYSFDKMNSIAAGAGPGSDQLMVFPFGNGAERILENQFMGAQVVGLDFNRHTEAHLLRAAQEGIVFALKYGFEIFQEMGLQTTVVRAGNSNMFLSPVFREAFVNSLGIPLELYETIGATGAALGAGVGAGVYNSTAEAMTGLKAIQSVAPQESLREKYQAAYVKWKNTLKRVMRVG